MAIVSCVLLAAGAARGQRVDESHLQGLKWRQIGPFRGGRSLTATGIPGNPNVFYFGAVSGGIWKTTNGGITWAPIFDNQPVSSIGSIAVAESDPNVIYAGSGEACIRGNISYGDGVYKSLDAGKTWTNVGLKDTRHIGAVIVDPHDADIVFVAAFGHAYGTNTERGIFRSRDGGKNWEKVLYKDEKTGGNDIVFDPQNSHILFASMWEAHRTPWSLTSGGPGSGLYKSIDGGTTWKRIEEHGLPKSPVGKIDVAVAPTNSNRVYALIQTADQGSVWRSDDGGENWKAVNYQRALIGRAGYYIRLAVSPGNENEVLVANSSFHQSLDGGLNFEEKRWGGTRMTSGSIPRTPTASSSPMTVA